MEFFDLMSISHRYMEILNPSTPEKIIKLGKILKLKKGSQVFVEGKLTHRKYQDKDGNDRYVTEVVANNFRVLDRRDSRPGGEEDFPMEEATSAETGSSGLRGEQHADDDLPF